MVKEIDYKNAVILASKIIFSLTGDCPYEKGYDEGCIDHADSSDCTPGKEKLIECWGSYLIQTAIKERTGER